MLTIFSIIGLNLSLTPMFLNFETRRVYYQTEYLLLDEKGRTQSPEIRQNIFFILKYAKSTLNSKGRAATLSISFIHLICVECLVQGLEE